MHLSVVLTWKICYAFGYCSPDFVVMVFSFKAQLSLSVVMQS